MAGFTETEFDSFYEVVAADTYNVSDFVSNPNSARTGLVNAFAAVKATGGTLNFSAGVTYIIDGPISFNDAEDFAFIGNGATIKAVDGMSHTSGNWLLRFNECRNFHLEDLTFDGNRENRTQAEVAAHGMFVSGCNSTAIGGGYASFKELTWTKVPNCDGVRFQGTDISSVNLYSRNILVYKCDATFNYRLGLFIRHGHNIQILGGNYSDNGQLSAAKTGTLPQSGIDIEPEEQDAVPGAIDILIKGATFARNQRTGIQIAQKGNPHDITIEGCYFTGGTPWTVPTLSRGSGISHAGSGTIIRNNTFESFSSAYNPVNAVLLLHGQPSCSDNAMVGNVFNNIGQSDPCVLIDGQSGTGNSVTGTRGYSITGALVTNQDPAGCTTSDNTTPGGAVVYPDGPPPVDVTFDDEGGPVFPTDIAFDAVSDPAAEFTATEDWTHTPVGTPAGATVLITGRGAGSILDEIAGVTYGAVALTRASPGIALSLVNETGAALAYHLGEGIPTGAQTVEVELIPGATGAYRAHCFTTTSEDDATEIEVSAIVEGASVTNPTITLSTGSGVDTFVAAALFTGRTNAQIAPGADYTEVAEYDVAAARAFSFIRRTTNPTGGDVTVDWVAAADEAAGIAVAIKGVTTVPAVTVLVAPEGIRRSEFEIGGVSIDITTPQFASVTPETILMTGEIGLPNVVIITDQPGDTPSVVARPQGQLLQVGRLMGS